MQVSTKASEAGVDGCQTKRFPIECSVVAARLAAESLEIQTLKWIESEKAGHDIGLTRAMSIWYTKHRQAWIAAMRAAGVAGF